MKEQIEISKKRSNLLTKIAEHQRKAHRFLGRDGTEDEDYTYEPFDVFIVGQDGEIDIVKRSAASDPFTATGTPGESQPECYRLTMPSSMGKSLLQERGLWDAATLEVELRTGQCNDSLQVVQLLLGKKVFIFRTKIQRKGPKKGKTRSWDSIHAVNQALWIHAQTYCEAREALLALGALRDILKWFQPLETAHLKTSTTGLDPSQSGWKHSQLPWFWYMDVAGDSVSSNFMKECEFVTLM
jgi:hypothetical protein